MSTIKPFQAFSFNSNVQKTTNDDAHLKKYVKNAYASMGVVTLLGGVTGYGVANEQFHNQKKEVIKNYDQYIDGLMDEAIKIRQQTEGQMSKAEIDQVRSFKYERYQPRLKRSLEELQKKFKGIYAKNIVIGTFVGALASGLILMKVNSEVKKKTTNNETLGKSDFRIPSNFNISKPHSNISFGERYWNNEYYSDEDETLAINISSYKLSDWPKGIDKKSLDVNNLFAKLLGQTVKKPNSDMEYHDLLINQEIPIPARPPEYYRGYHKAFNTERYQEFQKWPEYNKQKLRHDKVRRLVNFLRLENLKLEQKRIERETRMQMQSAFIKSKLFHNFISVVNQKSSDKKGILPNAIMLEGSNRDENVKTLKWMIDRTDTAYTYLDYNPLEYPDSNVFLAKLESALESAQNHYKETNGQRTIIYVNNFDLLIKKGMDTSDIKNMLQELSEEYKTTLVFETANSNELEPVALQDHRFGLKYALKDDIEPKAFKELEDEFFKMNTTKIAHGEGYRFNYIPGRKKFVDMFLGSFGHDKKTLWLEGNDLSDIDMACTFIDSIKKLKMFKDVEKIQVKSNTEEESNSLRNAEFEPLYKYTLDFKTIWEKPIYKIK